MAIASLLTSPLMPWTADEGHAMAQAVMGGDVLLKYAKIPTAARKLMDTINDGVTLGTDLNTALNRIVSLMSAGADLYDHLERAHETAEQLHDALSGMVDLDWERLLRVSSPESLHAVTPSDYWQDGIPVFHEGALPWCSVRHLFVLGFNEGHFPAGTGSSAVFTEAEWELIEAAGWPVVTNDLIRKRQRQLFATQLAAATESLTITFARRDAVGQALEPSSSLVFLARSLGLESDDLIYELDRSEDVRRIPDLPVAETASPTPPRELSAADIELGVDLLEVFSRKEGELTPLSPSAAETLMVSPLAWLLRRLDCEPREWGPDDFDVLTAGTLAHSVFEELFQPGRPLPEEDEIKERSPKVLQEWVMQIAPYLRSADWRVERYKFESEVLRAAIHWKNLLVSCNASIVGAEQWLRGEHGGIPLHGQSDLLVQTPSGKLLVVDYKKSSSGKRRERMLKGFDLQAHLYRLMIQTGGLPGFALPPDDIGIVYYLLNDTTALADGPVAEDGSVPGWEALSVDISSQAMQHLDRRLTQIRNGKVKLNTTADEDWWSKNASLPIYALDNSPLLRLFMRVAEVAS
jgi:RecB family exonuclease